MNLSNKVALVTGASSGIGKAIAFELLKGGAYCALASRNKSKLNEIRASWLKENPSWEEKVLVTPLDVTDKNQCCSAIEAVSKRWGVLHILVNNAGYGVYGPATKTPMEEVHSLFETNFFGAVQMTLEALPLLQGSKESFIVMVSSIAGKIATPWMSYYCASKFAMNAFAGALRSELMPYGIRVLVVMPGPVKTDFLHNAHSMLESKLGDCASSGHEPEDIAKATIKAIEKNKREIVVGFKNKMLICARNSMPTLADRVMSRVLGPW